MWHPSSVHPPGSNQTKPQGNTTKTPPGRGSQLRVAETSLGKGFGSPHRHPGPAAAWRAEIGHHQQPIHPTPPRSRRAKAPKPKPGTPRAGGRANGEKGAQRHGLGASRCVLEEGKWWKRTGKRSWDGNQRRKLQGMRGMGRGVSSSPVRFTSRQQTPGRKPQREQPRSHRQPHDAWGSLGSSAATPGRGERPPSRHQEPPRDENHSEICRNHLPGGLRHRRLWRGVQQIALIKIKQNSEEKRERKSRLAKRPGNVCAPGNRGIEARRPCHREGGYSLCEGQRRRIKASLNFRAREK